MALYKRGEVWHYDFAMNGKRLLRFNEGSNLFEGRMIQVR